jgi:hypothetical protein
MAERARERDIPETVAVILIAVPRLVLGVGVAYLRMKRGSKRASREFVRSLEAQGMPPEMARRLGESYRSDLSIRKLFGSGGLHFKGMVRP